MKAEKNKKEALEELEIMARNEIPLCNGSSKAKIMRLPADKGRSRDDRTFD